jgi:hypothetical protein
MTDVTMDKAEQLLEHYIGAGQSSWIHGSPGIGKTELVHQVGKKQERNVITILTNIRDTVDFHGIPVPDLKTGTTRWLVPGELPQIKRDGERGILLLDEFNTGTQQVMNACLGLALEGKIGEYILPGKLGTPGNWEVVATGNKMTDRTATVRTPTANRNRFGHINVIPDVEAWCLWAVQNNVAPEIIAFVRFRRELLHIMPKGDEDAFPTPRTLTKCSKHVGAPDAIRQLLFAGLVGEQVAGELDAFIGLYRSLGTLDDILTNPTTAKIPTEPSERYAVCTGLATIATRKTMPSLITYAKRIGSEQPNPRREFEVLTVTDAVRRDPALANVSAYGAWACANQDVLVQ